MVDQKITYCIMEVSSHALELHRVAGVKFKTAIFTNLTQDHLDYHKTIENYRLAKEKLFVNYAPELSVINIDDPAGNALASKLSGNVMTYGLSNSCDVKGEIVREDSSGIKLKAHTPIGEIDIESPLLGSHNAYNILAATGAAIGEGFTREEISSGIASLKNVPGRLETINEGQPFTVLVDYAHTDDALSNVLRATRKFTEGRVIVVFGCGGDRDKGKREKMGRVAQTLSDVAIVTSDNPRTENPEAIINDIEKGLLEGMKGQKDLRHYIKISDRKEAIREAITMAKPGDSVLIAGKGHEHYQMVGKEKFPFNDGLVAKSIIKGNG
jgi:UDP-N-acetylmuramoyl-L-alanyl-D-glutamate--2,6-diaminopimelate ligase